MVDATHDPQLLKGLLSFVLLHLLAEQESYGYEVVSRLHRRGLRSSRAPSTPPYLDSNAMVSVLTPSGLAQWTRPQVLRPTPAGYAELTRGTSNWRSLTQTIGSVLDRPVPHQPQEGS